MSEPKHIWHVYGNSSINCFGQRMNRRRYFSFSKTVKGTAHRFTRADSVTRANPAAIKRSASAADILEVAEIGGAVQERMYCSSEVM